MSVATLQWSKPILEARDSALLNVKDINVYYGAIHAVRNVSLEVHAGEIVSIIGANGAGKSTILKTLVGLLRSKTGEICLDGKSIAELSPLLAILPSFRAATPFAGGAFTSATTNPACASQPPRCRCCWTARQRAASRRRAPC